MRWRRRMDAGMDWLTRTCAHRVHQAGVSPSRAQRWGYGRSSEVWRSAGRRGRAPQRAGVGGHRIRRRPCLGGCRGARWSWNRPPGRGESRIVADHYRRPWRRTGGRPRSLRRGRRGWRPQGPCGEQQAHDQAKTCFVRASMRRTPTVPLSMPAIVVACAPPDKSTPRSFYGHDCHGLDSRHDGVPDGCQILPQRSWVALGCRSWWRGGSDARMRHRCARS